MSFPADKYLETREAVQRSAAVVVPLVYDLVRPKTVVDVGCGEGDWLREFARFGCAGVGYDGSLTDSQAGLVTYLGGDLIPRLADRMIGHADLAICVEVAEHLPESSADDLVATLVEAAPVILWSAAIPHQGGYMHINEQWPSYWAARFAEYGYAANQELRWQLWTDQRITPWYRMNLLLWADLATLADLGLRAEEPIPVVHPEMMGWMDR